MDISDAGSPELIVKTILSVEKELKIPVPIEQLCHQLDILEINAVDPEGFEGCLITDRNKHSGSILFNRQSHYFRQRFTIAHELGHFLIRSHIPSPEGKFICSAGDLRQFQTKETDPHVRIEVEANRFASLILMPPPTFRKDLGNLGDPNLEHVISLSKKYNVSKEAMARAYAQYHEKKIAIVITQNGLLKRIYKGISFPFITVSFNKELPSGSLQRRRNHPSGEASNLEATSADQWIDVGFGQKPQDFYEQVLIQKDGFSLVLLWVDDSIEEEENDERTSAQRFRDENFKWGR